MRILIRTFPPSTNPNYGGILQSWALQTALREIGHDVVVDSTRSTDRGPLHRAVRRLGISVARLLLSLGIRARGEWDVIRAEVNCRIFRFPDRHIEQVPLYRGPGKINRRVLRQVDAIVVGSDQVWRPRYTDVRSYLADFIPLSSARSIKIVSYAASFGKGTSEEFTPLLVSDTAPLARRFDAVSVREESGVSLARDLWGVHAVRMIDPTLLVTTERYQSLLAGTRLPSSAGIVTYLLDPTPEIQELAGALVSASRLPLTTLYRPVPRTYNEMRAAHGDFTRIEVEQWLAAILSADAVLTDSYHGTIFSILFNRPFLVVPNVSRGLARFETILGIFGLENRVAKFDGLDLQRLNTPVAWDRVNARVADERERGLAFLRDSLARDRN